MVSSVALVVANEQALAVLLFIPFGLAMVAAGYLIWTGGTRYAVARVRR
jgi:membrane protein DedA with SNARE-associated domain